ncbi:hypothetical protein O1B50_000125 [Vibrio cholerae]|nr:hypothetical protein [Vibrio cholerae]
MKTENFWVTVKQMADMTISSCKVATSQGQVTELFERDQIKNLIKKCELELDALREKEKALSRTNDLTP